MSHQKHKQNTAQALHTDLSSMFDNYIMSYLIAVFYVMLNFRLLCKINIEW